MGEYIIDHFVKVEAGEPYRLFPFGPLYKGGKRIDITPELAAKFRLPHFAPPIKLGSHFETTPAGGFIRALEVREDGLYAIPEWTEQGTAVMERGDFRYHSPEVIWEGGGFEDPATGKIIEGPLIIGDALLHTPHLGEAAALYAFNPKEGDHTMSDQEMVPVPASVWDRMLQGLFGARQDEPEPETAGTETEAVPAVDEFAAERSDFEAKLAEAQAQADAYRAELEAMKAETDAQARVAHFGAELEDTAAADDGEFHALLAGLDDETAGAIIQRIKAYSAQAELGRIDQEIGNPGAMTAEASDPITSLHALAQAKAQAEGIPYDQAVLAVRIEKPELVAAAFPADRKS